MFLEQILESNPADRYQRLEKRLLGIGRDVRSFRTLTVAGLTQMESVLEQRIEDHKSKDLKFVIENRAYQRDLLALKAVRLAKDIKEARDAEDVVIPGRTYYHNIKITENKAVGYRAQHMPGSRVSDWCLFNDDLRVMKVMEVLTFGSDDDFRKLYVEMADGDTFGATVGYSQKHIKESSESALNKMAAYCDQRWEGAWPWQTRTPSKVFSLIKEARMTRLEEIRQQLQESRRAIQEGEVERSELVVKISGIKDTVAKMIQSLAKLSGDFMSMGEEVASELGDEARSKLDNLSSSELRTVVDTLVKFQNAVGEVLDSVNGNAGSAGETPTAGLGGAGDGAPAEFDDPAQEPSGDEFGGAAPGEEDFGDEGMDDLDMDAAAPAPDETFGQEREMR